MNEERMKRNEQPKDPEEDTGTCVVTPDMEDGKPVGHDATSLKGALVERYNLMMASQWMTFDPC